MRNPLKRRPSTEPNPSLRERLRATKAKAGRVLAVNRILLQPDPKPAPAVDRALLTNYSTFLHLERSRVCAELYPHKGVKASQFVLGHCAAWGFFFTTRCGTERRPDLAPASSRAARVLDAAGVDWRADRDDTRPGSHIWDEGSSIDDGTRPRLPHGWPAPDAGLIEALGDLRRLDLAIDALGTDAPDDNRDATALPAWDDLEEHRADALARLVKERAESLTGMQAKAKAYLTPGVSGTLGGGDDIAASLARDLLGAGQSWLEPRPDPIFAAIEECRRLAKAQEAAFREWPHDTVEPPEVAAANRAASSALWDFYRGTVLKTTPRTAEGCRALARFVHEFLNEQGTSWDDEGPSVLDLIARSPLL